MLEKPDPKPQFAASFETRQIFNRLVKMEKGDSVTYTELSTLTGRVIDGSSSHLQSVRRMLLNQHGMVFDCMPGHGVKRLNDTEMVGASTRDMESVRRKSKRAATKLLAVEFDGLSDDDKRTHNARVGMFRTITAFSKPAIESRITAQISATSPAGLPTQQTIEFFKGVEKK